MHTKSILNLACFSILSLAALGHAQAQFTAADKGMMNKSASAAPKTDAVNRSQPSPGSGHSTPLLNLNTATQAQLAALPGIGEKAALVILMARAQKPFTNGQDFAERVCSKASVDTGIEVSIMIGSQQFSPRGQNPKDPGWKCAQGAKTYQTEGRTNHYVGHITLLR